MCDFCSWRPKTYSHYLCESERGQVHEQVRRQLLAVNARGLHINERNVYLEHLVNGNDSVGGVETNLSTNDVAAIPGACKTSFQHTLFVQMSEKAFAFFAAAVN